MERRRIAAFLLVIGIGLFVFLRTRSAPSEGTSEVRVEPSSRAASRDARSGNEPAWVAEREALHRRMLALSALSDEERMGLAQFAEGMRGPFSEPRVRLRLLEQLVQYLRRKYPDSWRAELERILRTAFPEDADALLALWRQREDFETWVDENRTEVARLAPDERRERMWEARRRFFGDDADRIFAAVRRNEAITERLEEIDANPQGTVPQRFDQLMNTIEEQYGEGAPSFVDERRQEILDRFVATNSIQADLAAMDRDARYGTLRTLREETGMDTEALDRWAALDRVRDQRWDAGQAYMQSRTRLEQQLSGEALTRELETLRQRTFGAEAESIANEEAGGYFRFRDPRTFGMN